MSSVGGVGSTAASSDGSYGDNSVSSDSDSELSRPSNSESWDSDRAGDNDSSSSLSQSTVDQLASGPTTSDSIVSTWNGNCY